MPKAPIIVYDQNMNKRAYLENAYGIGYEMLLNSLWTASFSLPGNDPKNAECLPLHYVEIWDDNERIDLFRILPNSSRRSNDGLNVTYTCEHVLGTLLDDVLFQYHTIGNLGIFTADVLAYLLSQQTTAKWQLGTVDFARQFEYNWENENLLGALFSVPKPFADEYMWTWDTTTFPWTLNLVVPPPETNITGYIRYRVNMQELTKQTDPTNIATRIYGLGYGEGVNQLTFAEINGGFPYIEDEATIAKYGIIARIFADTRYEYPETLLGYCHTLLDQLKVPYVSYTASASDIHKLTGKQVHKFVVGYPIRVQDEEMGEDFIARVVKVSKSDMKGSPGDVMLEIANKSQDISGTIADLQNRQRINEVYSQGATNFNSHDFADNCDPQHPAVLKFWIPEETARINKVRLSYECQAFRASERALAAAPAVSSGPSSKTSSGPSTRTTTAAGGALISTDTGDEIWKLNSQTGLPEVMEFTGTHNHGIPDGTQLMTASGGAVTYSSSGGHAHGLKSHYHTFTIPNHTHQMDHTHDIDHTHTIPSHTHEIEFGIYEGPTPSSVTVRVDGKTIPGLGTSGDDIDIIPYLSKDASGRVQRGTWHEIEIAPNDLGRIVASVHEQIFVQSRGGGNY